MAMASLISSSRLLHSIALKQQQDENGRIFNEFGPANTNGRINSTSNHSRFIQKIGGPKWAEKRQENKIGVKVMAKK
jgi:hypothetical protein